MSRFRSHLPSLTPALLLTARARRVRRSAPRRGRLETSRSAPFRALVALLAAGAVLASAPPAAAEQPSTTLFVPGDYVPLSKFKQRLMSTGTTSFQVEPDILAWIAAQTQPYDRVRIAFQSSGITVVDATSYNPATGNVTYGGPLTGRCVVVYEGFRQDLDIETHWDAAVNLHPSAAYFRGGFVPGATDGLVVFDYNQATQSFTKSGGVEYVGSSHFNPDDPDAGLYYYDSDRYALFTDGSGVHLGTYAPDYEVYVGEGYSLMTITPLAAVAFSDWTRADTGFPVAHRNASKAFTSSVLGEKLEDGIPVFQLVHGHIVDVSAEYDPMPEQFPGRELSLGSFILPPTWTAVPARGYPILFNGFYDIHDAMFSDEGPGFLRTLAELYRHPAGPRLAIGVLWNGGGATATFTTQGSAYHGANELILNARDLLAGSATEVVFTGTSRGGMTALAMGSNPYKASFAETYTTRFVHASSAIPRAGTGIELVSPTYWLGMKAMQSVSGYQDAWMEEWTLEESGVPPVTGRQLVYRNAFNVSTESAANALTPDSDLFRDALEEEGNRVNQLLGGTGGVGVVYRNGSNDFSRSLVPVVEYVDHLRDLDPAKVSAQLSIFYRAGHGGVDEIDDDGLFVDAELLNKVFDDDRSLDTETRYYGPDPANPGGYVLLNPPASTTPYVPVVFDFPMFVGRSQTHTWEFLGEPGSVVDLRMGAMPTAWWPGDPYTVPALTSFGQFTLSAVGSSGEFGAHVEQTAFMAQPAFTGSSNRFWWYELDYYPAGLAGPMVTLGLGDFAPPTPVGEPVLYISVADVMGTHLANRTGGLAGDEKLLFEP